MRNASDLFTDEQRTESGRSTSTCLKKARTRSQDVQRSHPAGRQTIASNQYIRMANHIAVPAIKQPRTHCLTRAATRTYAMHSNSRNEHTQLSEDAMLSMSVASCWNHATVAPCWKCLLAQCLSWLLEASWLLHASKTRCAFQNSVMAVRRAPATQVPAQMHKLVRAPACSARTPKSGLAKPGSLREHGGHGDSVQQSPQACMQRKGLKMRVKRGRL